MKTTYCIIDCFVDEPACFGVPPFISPYPRYVCGALMDAGTEPDRIRYLTIDHLRENNFKLEENHAAVFLIGGAVVPGRYLGARIGTIAEIRRITENNPVQKFIIGGPAAAAFADSKNVTPVKYDIEKYAYTLVRGCPEDCRRTAQEAGRWGRAGAWIVRSHPSWPDLICEMETYRGCPRLNHCSFCFEGLFEGLDFRQVDDILAETDALINAGITRFRSGRQADILQYMTPFSEFRCGFPRPEPSAVEELFGEFRLRRDQGKIRVLNIDNANPGTIANFPEESERILAAISSAVTPGDTMALGIESFDPEVSCRNNLKVDRDQAVFVIKMINEICGFRKDGIPVLLPGVNLVQGLAGETSATFEKNYAALKSIMDQGLLLKRINIRKHQPYPGTPLALTERKSSARELNRFEFYRDKIRKEIDTYMLRAIYPAGTVLNDVMILDHREEYSLGKQISSYSITVTVPETVEKKTIFSAVITGHRERSLEGLVQMSDVNSLSRKGLEFIPGISRKGAADIILARPFADMKAFRNFLAEKDIRPQENILEKLSVC